MSGTQAENSDPEDLERQEVGQGSPDSGDVQDGVTSDENVSKQEKMEQFMEWWNNLSVEEQHVYMQKVEQFLKLREVSRKVDHLHKKQKRRQQEAFDSTAIGRLQKRHRDKRTNS